MSWSKNFIYLALYIWQKFPSRLHFLSLFPHFLFLEIAIIIMKDLHDLLENLDNLKLILRLFKRRLNPNFQDHLKLKLYKIIRFRTPSHKSKLNEIKTTIVISVNKIKSMKNLESIPFLIFHMQYKGLGWFIARQFAYLEGLDNTLWKKNCISVMV